MEENARGRDLRDFFELPLKAWQRILFFEFGSSISLIGIYASALFMIAVVGAAAILQNFGGVSSFVGAISWLDLVAMKRIDEMLTGSLGTFLTVFGITATMLGSLGLLRLIESAFDQLWGKLYSQTLLQRLPVFWLILCVVPILLSVSIGLSTYFLLDHGIQASNAIKIFGKTIQFASSFIAFGFLYKSINGAIVNWRSALSGGFWAAVGFETVKHFILLILNPAHLNFSQPVTTFLLFSILMCMGFVLCSGALVFGNHVAYVEQFKNILDEMAFSHQRSEPRPTREIALAALIELTRRFYIRDGSSKDMSLGLDPVDLARIARTTPQRGKHVIRLLESVGLVKVIIENGRETSVLKVHPENLSLDEFLARLEQRVQSKSLNVPTMLSDPSNQWFWQEYERALKDRFGSLSLRDLAELSSIMKKRESQNAS